MVDDFTYDVFLSHSSKDKAVVRDVAQRLRGDGLRVWFDEWEIKAGDSVPAKIEEGLENSRVLVLCMSANAFGSDWAQLEAGTFRFRDPLNKERRFIPLRLDKAPMKGSLAQFLHINWRPDDREQQYAKLLEACRGNVDLSCTTEPSAFVTASDSAARIVNRLKYYVYVSHSKVQMLYGQLASIESYKVQESGSTVYSKLAAVVSSLRKEPGIIALPSQELSVQTGYYEDTDKWNMAALDNSDTGRETASTAFCMYKDKGNSLTLLLGSPGNMIGSFGDQSRHSISPSWTTDKCLLALVESLERPCDANSEAATLEGRLDRVLYFCGDVCAYMPRVAVNVLFRTLYMYRLDAATWAKLFAYAPDAMFADTAEHLIIGSPICVALADNAPDHV